jgi:hypothetical protein
MAQNWVHQVGTVAAVDAIGERRTIEARLTEIEHNVSDIVSAAKHIHGVLFGFENEQATDKDSTPSIHNTLLDIEGNIREASHVLEEVASALSTKTRLKKNG